jgi:hypothetical protein
MVPFHLTKMSKIREMLDMNKVNFIKTSEEMSLTKENELKRKEELAVMKKQGLKTPQKKYNKPDQAKHLQKH